MKTGMFEIELAVNGKPVREYSHSDGRVYVEAKGGTQYTIRVKNNGSKRVMVVLSVDGIDVLEGKPAEECKRGYIINAYSSDVIKGYRVDNDNVASFKFFRKKDGHTYAKEVTGSTANCGVIGVRVFEEKVKPEPVVKIIEKHHYHTDPWVYPIIKPLPYYPPITWTTCADDGFFRKSADAMTFSAGNGQGSIQGHVDMNSALYSGRVDDMCSSVDSVVTSRADASPLSQTKGTMRSLGSSAGGQSVSVSTKANFDTGTGWGEKVNDTVTLVNFDVGNVVSEFGLYYASRKSLEDLGIQFDNKPKIAEGMPKAFGGYCKPPLGWQG
jgi:hypothetical protein